MKAKDSLFLSIGAVAVIASAGVIGVAVLGNSTHGSSNSTQASTGAASGSTQQTASASQAGSSTPSNASTTASSGYKNGTYTSSTTYMVPDGMNSLSATLTINNGAITSIKTSGNYSGGQSEWYVNDFQSSVSSDASGQPLANYSPSRIGGASLTTWAFDDVLDKIRTNAAA